MDSNSRTVLCIDKSVDSAQDLLSDQLTSFLAEVCEKGRRSAELSPSFDSVVLVHHLYEPEVALSGSL